MLPVALRFHAALAQFGKVARRHMALDNAAQSRSRRAVEVDAGRLQFCQDVDASGFTSAGIMGPRFRGDDRRVCGDERR